MLHCNNCLCRGLQEPSEEVAVGQALGAEVVGRWRLGAVETEWLVVGKREVMGRGLLCCVIRGCEGSIIEASSDLSMRQTSMSIFSESVAIQVVIASCPSESVATLVAVSACLLMKSLY